MPFLAEHPGTLSPEDLALVRNVFRRIVSEPWVSSDQAGHERFGRFVMRTYTRGMWEPEKLFRLCLIAAKHELNGTRALSAF